MRELQEERNTKQSNLSLILRRIFLNLLIVIFITMMYFYFSETFGSISTYFLKEKPEFKIIFSLPLFIITFFAFLAGPIFGALSGFFGEFLYQVSFYNNLYPQWLIMISLIGLLSGIYRYNPKKYLQGKNIYYAFIILVIQTFGLMSLIIIFRLLLNPSMNLESILINFGFTYFIEGLLSAIFIVPISLFLYDRIFSEEERHVYNLFLTHHPAYASDHTFYLKFGTTYIYFCSRCSGVVLGSIIAIFFFHVLELSLSFTIPAVFAIILCILLPIPGLIDWGTQRLLRRTSNTRLRLITGFLIGIALNAMTYANEYYIFILGLTTFYFFILFLMMYVSHRRERKKIEEENKKFYEEEI